MTPEQFVAKVYPFAEATQTKTGISAIAIMAQSAVESSWGNKALGNNFFGIKSKPDTPHEQSQLLTTTEYHNNPGVIYPEIISITKQSTGKYKYKVKDWFRKYDTPEESFIDHAQFFLENPRYQLALKVKDNAEKFIDAIADAGYATDPNYSELLKAVAKTIERYV
jgi:flagellum-specific peptidoglycan hydrolase FlgJ